MKSRLLAALTGAALLTACAGNGSTSSLPQLSPQSFTRQTAAEQIPLLVPFNVTATYNCKASVLGSEKTFTGSVAMSGTTPATVAPSAKVEMTDFQAIVTVPASLVNELISYGVTSVSGKATTLDISATDAKTAKVNVAGTGITFPSTKLVENEALTIKLPAKTKSVGPWTSGSTAGTMDFETGNVDLTVDTSLVDVNATCTSDPIATISATQVS